MDYCFLKGFLVVLLIQHCTCEDLSTSVQSSTAVTLQDDQASPHEPELTPAEVVPVVAPPSLKEVQQAVQEASEQVEGRGAEEVLKGLLERVVEAALGQAEGGGEVKADEAAEQETIEEVGAERGETESEVMEQAVEEEAEGEDIGGKEGGDTGVELEREVAEVHAFQDVAEEEKGPVEGEVETAAGSVQGTAAGVETGGREAEEVEVVDESPDTKVSHEVVEEAAVASDETGGYLAVEEAGVEGELSEEQGEIESQEVEETPAVVGGELEQETVVESDPSLAVADVEQIDLGAKKEALEEETQIDDMEGEAIEPPADSDEMETTQSVVGEPVEDEEEGNVEEDGEGTEVEDEQGHLAVEGGAAEGVEAEGADAVEAKGESVIKDELVAPVDEGVEGEEAQIALETSHGSVKEDQEAPVISAPEPGDGADGPVEQSPENQGPTTGGAEAEVNTLGDEKSNDANDIITASEDLLPHDPVMAQPTLDNLVEDVAAEGPQAEGEEPGEANELVEDIAVAAETSELSLEAWKIGAISAAVFLVLETVVIIIYIFKCRDKNSSRALQRACEEGCVEPEAATGGDCSDDTLPAGNGDAQQIAVLDPSDVASTLAQNKEQHEEEHVIAMSDLPPSSTEESANTGPGPDSSQDPRTSIL